MSSEEIEANWALWKKFFEFDKDNDFHLTPEEVKAGLSGIDGMTEKEIDTFISAADSNDDGKLNVKGWNCMCGMTVTVHWMHSL